MDRFFVCLSHFACRLNIKSKPSAAYSKNYWQTSCLKFQQSNVSKQKLAESNNLVVNEAITLTITTKLISLKEAVM